MITAEGGRQEDLLLRGGGSPEIGIAASRLAALMILPPEVLETAPDDCGTPVIDVVQQLARQFGVALPLVETRLEAPGISDR